LDLFSWFTRTLAHQFSTASKLPQESHIIFVEQPDLVDAIADDGDAFDAERRTRSGPLL